MARVIDGSQSLPASHTFVHKGYEPSRLHPPAAEHHRPLAGTHLPSCSGSEALLAWVACYVHILNSYVRLETVVYDKLLLCTS